MISILNVTHFLFKPSQFYAVEGIAEAAQYADFFNNDQLTSMNCVHVAAPGMSLLVDASNERIEPDSPTAQQNVPQPPNLLAQLAANDIAPADITHVVITHPHTDHISGLTCNVDGQWRPIFANAKHYLGKADWDSQMVQTELQDPSTVIAQTLKPIHDAGLLVLVEGDLDFGNGVQIWATPGETPGHQAVRVQSGNDVTYIIGDLFHFPLEFTHMDWLVTWKDRPSALASRQRIMQAVTTEHAHIIATHIFADTASH
ncbi:MAG: MBL fold metallo-hydrolase [Anaerolineae bacterium]|nr:MBL fold metallo-hydrolase [Anaerolineae bacterium]